ncbi:MAG: extracellular solute-binding protein [Thermomicrobiales bacterium]
MSSNRRVSRRSFVQGGVGAATGVAIASRSRSYSARAQDAQEITFMNWDAVPGTPIETAINAFQEASGISVNIQPTPTADYETKMRTLLASGAPPDIMRINDDFVRGYSIEETLLDLNPYIQASGINPADYFDHPYKFPIQPDGQHTAWTIGTQPSVIFYNVDAFNEAGVPLPPSTWSGEAWGWAEFLDAAMKLSIPDERWGVLLYKDTSFETIYPVNHGEPTGIYSADGTQFTLANPTAIEAVQWVTDLTLVHGVQPAWEDLTADDAANQYFVSGRAAMLSATFGFTSYARANATFNWNVTPPPAGVAGQTTIATLIDFVIPKDAQNPDGAWELLKFLGGPEGGKIFAEAGAYVPVHREPSSLLVPVEGTPPANLGLIVEATGHATNENFSQHIQRARQIYRPQLDLVFTGQQTAAEMLTGIKEQVELALAGEV